MTSHFKNMLFLYLVCAVVIYGYWLSSAALFILGPFYLLGIIILASRSVGSIRHRKNLHQRFARYTVDWIRFLFRLKIVRLHIVLTYYVASIRALLLARVLLRVT